MVFDLQVLSIKQKELDDKILEMHNLDSNNTIKERILAFMVELAELANETRCFKYWSLKSASATEVVLEEYVDGIHFLTSLGNQIDLDNIFETDKVDVSLTEQFSDIFACAGVLKDSFNKTSLSKLYVKYLELGIMLGFDSKTIIEGYYEKNKENHKRQETGY